MMGRRLRGTIQVGHDGREETGRMMIGGERNR